MKIYGNCIGNDKSELLEQVTLEIDASELRELAAFITQCAEEIELDDEWEHEHLCDYLGRVLEHDLIVYNSKKSR